MINPKNKLYRHLVGSDGAAAIKRIKSIDEVGVTCKITKKKYNLVIKLS